ncbi:MAG: hypothetical protein HYZ54_02575 [Ignavibacteriae bacterium]|nr:hypothetical protein [Ignavibacteriota bacterium]
MIISIIANIQKQNMNTDLVARDRVVPHGKFPLTRQADKSIVAELFIYKLLPDNKAIMKREQKSKTGTLM